MKRNVHPQVLRRTRRILPSIVGVAAMLYGAAAAAADAPVPQGVVALSASATAEVDRDLMTVTLGTTREGTDARAVQAQLKQALDAALAEARKAAVPGQVDVRSGNFSLYPRYATGSSKIAGWQGSTQVVIEGRDMPAIASLTGRIDTLTIGNLHYSLSREQREKAEASITAEAIGRYRAKASEYAKQFGYAGYELREVNVSSDSAMPPPPMMARAMSKTANDAPLPVEPGKDAVTVSVNGSVTLTR
jgi:predicted secreted protein